MKTNGAARFFVGYGHANIFIAYEDRECRAAFKKNPWALSHLKKDASGVVVEKNKTDGFGGRK